MTIRLDSKWIRILERHPESGMGYQTVDIRLRNGIRVNRLFVYNAQQLDWPDSRPAICSDDIEEIIVAQDEQSGTTITE